jgi:hypothetical protein
MSALFPGSSKYAHTGSSCSIVQPATMLWRSSRRVSASFGSGSCLPFILRPARPIYANTPLLRTAVGSVSAPVLILTVIRALRNSNWSAGPALLSSAKAAMRASLWSCGRFVACQTALDRCYISLWGVHISSIVLYASSSVFLFHDTTSINPELSLL